MRQQIHLINTFEKRTFYNTIKSQQPKNKILGSKKGKKENWNVYCNMSKDL